MNRKLFPRTFRIRLVKFIIFVLLIFCFNSSVYSQGKKYPVNVSAWYHALSLNKTKQDIADFNLTLCYTNIGSIRSFNLGVGYTLVQENMEGGNLNAGVTSVMGKFKGAGISAIGNVHLGEVKGFEIGGLFNTAAKKLDGVQIGGVANYVAGFLTGAQMSLVVNIAGNNLTGFQAGNSNIVGMNMKGAQIGTTFNAVSNKVKGLQLAPGNIAGFNEGVQIGGLNVTHENRLLQVGIVNVTDYQYGVPVGVVNVATKNGDIAWINYSSNFAAITTGAKINANKFVSLLELGWNIYDCKDINSASLGAYYGYDFDFGKYYKITPNVGYVEIFEEETGTENWNHQFALQARVFGEVELNKFSRFFAGLGYSYRVQSMEGADQHFGKFLVLAGFSFF